jgi:hypothetical protein
MRLTIYIDNSRDIATVLDEQDRIIKTITKDDDLDIILDRFRQDNCEIELVDVFGTDLGQHELDEQDKQKGK